jgi:hypothetical protein
MKTLDVGVGFGRWGMLLREFLDVWDDGITDGKWKRTVDGVEIYGDYIKDYHKYFYDTIHIGNAIDFIKMTNENYDLIILGDIIEHFNKKEGKELIDYSLSKSKFVMINLPIGKHWGQGKINNNEYEKHKSVWYNSDFTGYKHNRIKCFKDFMHRDFSVILLSNKKIKFEKRFGKYFEIKNILKHKFGLRKIFESYEKRK